MLTSDLVRNALDSTPDAMVIIDSSGAIVFSNCQITALFGYEADEIAGRNVDVLLPERFRSQHLARRQTFTTKARVRPMGVGLDLFARRNDGSEFPVEISLSPMSGGAVELTAASIRDMTDRRAIEMELKSARETADRANQAKSRFLATASHDLRQPVQTLALLNGALCRMVTDPEPAEALAQQEQAIRAMSRLLNALLDISKLESGAIKPEMTDFTVVEIFAELRNEFAGLAAHKGLQLEVEASRECVHSDPSLVEQVLRNLISNAIKYTQRGFVQLRCLHDQAFVRLEVLDTGIGMPASALTHIYDEFYQVGASGSTARDGYGLGLSIVNRIVNLLGHRLEVRSELGKGSTFSLELPRGRTAQAHTRAQCGPASASAKTATLPHILLVEDDAGVRKATRLLLTVEGFRVTTAGSLAEAIEQSSAHRDIALLVTDYHLANQETGVQVIAAVRSQLAADLKAILITGDTSSAAHAIQHNDRVRMTSKPINADEFIGLLRELLAI
jgi:two-component system, sensor histidine kinase